MERRRMKREGGGGGERRWRVEVVWEQPTVGVDCAG